MNGDHLICRAILCLGKYREKEREPTKEYVNREAKTKKKTQVNSVSKVSQR
jgi:hypothetical protein